MIIYKTTNLINGKIYIGQDFYNNPNYLGSGKYLQRAIKKYGKENFRKDIVQFCHSKEELDSMEIWWINVFNARNSKIGYNITKGGKGCSGRKMSEEHKAKIGLFHKGKKLSEETKIKIRLAKKGQTPWLGKKLSEEHKQKLSLAKKGQTPWNKGKTNCYSEETKLKMSLAQKKRRLNTESV